MNVDLGDATLLFLLVGLFAWWWRSMNQKALALRRTAAHCERLGLQLLDQTLAFKHYRRARDAYGRQRLCRVYGFDFSKDGQDRRQGEILLVGLHVLRIVLDDGQSLVTDF